MGRFRGVGLIGCACALLIGRLLVTAAPAASTRHRTEMRRRQACGDQLADTISMVCSNAGGYNFAFRPEHHRFRRGIVEECCYKSCTPAMIALYCQADPTDDPNNVQIRKRSDSSLEDTEQQQGTEEINFPMSQSEIDDLITQVREMENADSSSKSTAKKEGEETYKILNLLTPSGHNLHKHNSRTKMTPNDTIEEEFIRRNSIPNLRHKSHHHSTRQLHGRKASTKTKRAKGGSAESSQTFQIGLVKPYFAGKPLATYRSNFVHHTALS